MSCAFWFVFVAQVGVFGATGKAAGNLSAPNEKTRAAALAFLVQMGPRSSPHVRAICDRLVNSPTLSTETALEAVERIDPAIYTPLRELLLSKRFKDKAAQVEKFQKMGTRAGAVVPVLVDQFRLIANAANPDGKIPADAFDFAVSVQTLLLTLKPDDSHTIATMKAIAVPRFANGVGPPNQPIVFLAAAFLCEWADDDAERKKQLLPVLASTCTSADTALAVESIKKCGRMGAEAKSLLPLIKKLKLSDRAEVREAATEAAAKIEKP